LKYYVNDRHDEGDFWEEDEMVTRVENQILEADFIEEEIFKAIKDSYVEGAPGPTIFPFYFIINFGMSLRQT
jgi:hypothetical protein